MKNENNNEPVHYCKLCLSLTIRKVEFQSRVDSVDHKRCIDYCVDCGNTEIAQDHILDWEDKYKDKYGRDFLTEQKNDEQ